MPYISSELYVSTRKDKGRFSCAINAHGQPWAGFGSELSQAANVGRPSHDISYRPACN